MSTINYAIDENAIATITLNRDEKRNAFNHEMAERFLQNLERAERENARVVVMRANPGVKVWCAGHDLSELDPGALDAQNPERGFGEVLYVKE
jgi:methylmalonyl-CoA decarboxylase